MQPTTDTQNTPPAPEAQLRTYLVGGAVRDGLLGLAVKDRDHVVVGATPALMEGLGFFAVGRDFPVFHHPVTHEEYALARTERKSGQGYKGFTVYAETDVTLEQDLGRRDLTINAMAQDANGHVIDPHGGQDDLRAGVLRHVSPQAFVEDPVRVLRLARFAARFPDFTVAPKTLGLVRDMVASGEMQHLVAERVWQELSKGLMEGHPERMFEVLRETGALKELIPELDALWGVPQPAKHHPEVDTGVHIMMVLQQAARAGATLDVRLACLFHDLGKGITPKDMLPSHHGHEGDGVPLVQAACKRLKVPSPIRDLAMMVCKDHTLVHTCQVLRMGSLVDLFEKSDAFRRPERFANFLLACEFDARGRLGLEDRLYPQRDYVTRALEIVRGVDAGAIAKHVMERAAEDAAAQAISPDGRPRKPLSVLIPLRIHAVRVHSLAGFQKAFELAQAEAAEIGEPAKPAAMRPR